MKTSDFTPTVQREFAAMTGSVPFELEPAVASGESPVRSGVGGASVLDALWVAAGSFEECRAEGGDH